MCKESNRGAFAPPGGVRQNMFVNWGQGQARRQIQFWNHFTSIIPTKRIRALPAR